MTDYVKSTGSSGTMMIRDTGSYVEFWLKAGAATYNHALPWGYTVNGVTENDKIFDFVSGGSYQRLLRLLVTTDQTVTFRLFSSGTTGLGGPTTFALAINRTSVPNAPSTPTIPSLSATYANVNFVDGSNGGAAIDSRQLSYGKTSAASTTVVSSDGSTTITGLTKGTLYYVKARTHNAKGYSAWSPVKAFTTWREPDAPGRVVLSNTSQSSVHASFTGGASSGGTVVLEWRIGYGLSSAAPTDYLTGYNMDITGLTPGKRYYFWAQARNAIGWSPLSVVSSITLLPGAHIVVGAEGYKNAVPYVNVDDVWYPAEPWVKIAGLWKKTS